MGDAYKNSSSSELSNLSSQPTTCIPNDVSIGGISPSLLLLTGPNMGGKSVLLKTCGLCVILAHIGCAVPAAECQMTLCDRLFVRAGASDRIVAGESTLFVEMAETAQMLTNATERSFVVLDELGRGTATHDGAAIASAVMRDVTQRIKCRAIVATHHHSLTVDMADSPDVQMCYMMTRFDTRREEAYGRDDSDNNQSSPTDVIFLYQCISGVCPRSFGMNVARLAGLPLSVVDRANEISRHLESSDKQNFFSSSTARKLIDNSMRSQTGLFDSKSGDQKQVDVSQLSATAVSIFSRVKNLQRKIAILQRRKKNRETEAMLAECGEELKALVQLAKEVKSGTASIF